MTCHCRRWSSEPSSAQILYQIGQLLQLLLHLLPLAVAIPLFLLGGLLQLLHPVFQRRNLASTGAVLGTLTTGRVSRTFSFASDFINPSINTQVGVGKLGQLLPGGGRGADEAARLGARPGKAGEQTAAKRPPPPARLTHRRPTRPCLAPRAARQPRLKVYTQGGCAREEGGLAQGLRATPPGQEGGEPRRGPPSPPPPTPPPSLRATGAPALQLPVRPRGRPPSPRRDRGTGGGRS